MSKTALLTLGRLPKSLDIARALADSGWRVLVAEPSARHLTGVSHAVARSFQVTAPVIDANAYLDELCSIVRKENVDLVVPVSEETMHVAALADRFVGSTAQGAPRIFTMSATEVRRLYDKLGFARFAQSIGLTVPSTFEYGDAASQALIMAGAVVLKPRFSCAGRGVQVLARGEDLTRAARAASPGGSSEGRAGQDQDVGQENRLRDAYLIVQKFISGMVHSTCSVVHQGRVLGTVVYRAAQLSGTVAVAFDRVEHHAITAWVETFARAARWSGFLSFDFVVDEGGVPHGIECNPRATSGIHFMLPQHLAEAMTFPERIESISMRPETRLQQFWACLSEVQKLRPGIGLLRGLRALATTPDVSWRADDPWPLLSMPYTAWPIIAAANQAGVSFGEVATRDLDWRPSDSPKKA